MIGDHPHTNPGDGRVECQTCGKWVHLVTHSCKRVPVTDVALERWRAENGYCNKDATLGYYADDDGVWLKCDWPLNPCGFRKNLGFEATLADVVVANYEHVSWRNK